MPGRSSKFPTELEMLILKLLWIHGPLPVRKVRQLLAVEADRDLAHTTVVTTLNKMVKKGYLSRQQDGNAYIFEAAVDEDEISSGFLEDVLHRIFDGSAKSLLLNLLNSDSVSPEEHDELRKLVQQRRNQSENNNT